MMSVGTSVKIADIADIVAAETFFFFLTLLGPALGPDLLDAGFRELEMAKYPLLECLCTINDGQRLSTHTPVEQSSSGRGFDSCWVLG